MKNDQQLFELWKVIIRNFPYATQILFRGISKTFIDIFSQASSLPALTTQDLIDAGVYFQEYDKRIKEKVRAGHVFSISRSPDSQDAVIARLVSTMAHIENGQWVDDSMFLYRVSVKKVKDKAALLRFMKVSSLQYADIAKHHQRSHFITTYLALPNSPNHPRSRHLKNQSTQSLERLVLSLKRRHDTASQAMLDEVKTLLATKQQESESSLSKQMKRLKI
ncbi:MAG: hypothetical protein AB7I18_14460 [Candidatus Berkiella sp.]